MDYSFLIGIPYEKMNCWELVKEFYKQVFTVDLKLYYAETPPKGKDEIRNLIYTNVGDFILVEKGAVKFGDLILIKISGIESHIAVYLEGDKILHTLDKTGSIIDKLSRYEKMITGFYRLREGVKLC